MKDIPVLWFWLSGAFFVTNILMFVALGVALLRISKVVEELKPKVDETLEKVQATSLRVEEVANQLKTTVDELSSRAKSVAGNADIVAQTATQQFAKFSPFVGIAFTVFRFISAYRQHRKQTQAGTGKGARVPAKPGTQRASAIADLLQALVKLKG